MADDLQDWYDRGLSKSHTDKQSSDKKTSTKDGKASKK